MAKHEYRIYHFTHLDNLPRIVTAGGLWSDNHQPPTGCLADIGQPNVKSRRRTLDVSIHPGTVIADYVPFYFCPRSVMLYVLHMANHPDLVYRDGQGPLVYLSAEITAVKDWLDANPSQRWAFTDRNAAAAYAQFSDDWQGLRELNWAHVRNNDFRDRAVRDGKQAEFLVHEFFPLRLFDIAGASTIAMRDAASAVLPDSLRVSHRPDWYF